MRIQRQYRHQEPLTPAGLVVRFLESLLVLYGLGVLVTELIGYARAILFVFGDDVPARHRRSPTGVDSAVAATADDEDSWTDRLAA